jgi:hypothetical protein
MCVFVILETKRFGIILFILQFIKKLWLWNNIGMFILARFKNNNIELVFCHP